MSCNKTAMKYGGIFCFACIDGMITAIINSFCDSIDNVYKENQLT